ncbi:elongation of very long chain fatty acids protein AAEL008004 [Nephila pilipes]|uniref:Elongation of very long chain fatty acids protein n=1 Tax=Nephila pilipes TaxID=299642 RepID=A0A8X6QN12_NEPPI|nr:elongation of very long chain fatty acids protein AAEL008004 [Nephila pilipes]
MRTPEIEELVSDRFGEAPSTCSQVVTPDISECPIEKNVPKPLGNSFRVLKSSAKLTNFSNNWNMATFEDAYDTFTDSLRRFENKSWIENVSVMKYFQAIDESIGKQFDTGDEEVRTWFLVRQNFLPFFLCAMYVLLIKIIGPAVMKNRKPFTLRGPMILFNLFLVASYSITMIQFFQKLPYLETNKFCKGSTVRKGDLTYTLVGQLWFLYILKYIEFIDTIFFILRKKYNLITNLHVIHHTIVPIVGWIMLRTERSGFQSIPVLINGFVHIIMYTYYGLAAVGPHMKKYLWWKKYLTMLQMVQFVFIILFVAVIAPASGCSIVKSSLIIDAICGVLFFILFYNFYYRNFNQKTKLT